LLSPRRYFHCCSASVVGAKRRAARSKAREANRGYRRRADMFDRARSSRQYLLSFPTGVIRKSCARFNCCFGSAASLLCSKRSADVCHTSCMFAVYALLIATSIRLLSSTKLLTAELDFERNDREGKKNKNERKEERNISWVYMEHTW